MHASPTGGQAARYDSNEPSRIPHADPNHRAISCRLPEVHAVGKPLGRKLAWWISKIATNHFNYQPNHNSESKYIDPDPHNSAQYRHYRKATLTSLVRLRNLGINRGQGPNNAPKIVDFEETCALPHQ